MAVWLLLILGSFLQQPGKTTFDTKFDLTADPVRFLGRSLHLWNPQASLGELQNQAYGYLFPQGPFFVIGHLLHLPPWVTQRLWCALLLIAAYEGAKRLGRALEIGPWWACALAGVAFAATPRLLSEVGTLTGEILPTVVLPWVVLPLVHAQRGRVSLRAGALLSGIAVLFMGGLNAVENLAALPLALIVVLASARAVRWRLAAWWVGAVVLAAFWWMAPLLLLGKYSPPFLDYVETASVTTRPLSFANILRGSDQWLQFFTIGGRPWWPAGYALASSPVLIVAAGLVAALGLAGLWLRGMPARLPLALSVLLGLTCLYAGHSGALGSPLAGPVQHLLDGPLAAFRNVHKVDPLVRLPIALGLGHAVSRGADRWRVRRESGPGGGWLRVRAVPVPLVAVGATLVLVAVSAGPLFLGQLRTPGWTKVPTAWSRAADYLATHDNGTRALVVPGSGFGQQTWGDTIDEPLQGLARSPWVTRSQVPLAPGQTIRFLDALESRLDSGVGSNFLADDLARSGIGYVVDRHDLDLRVSDAPASLRVTTALQRSPGLTRVASYGRTGVGDQGLVDIYRVDRAPVRVQAVDDGSVRSVAGAADDVISVLESGLLGPLQPVVMAGDPAGTRRRVDFVADGYRLLERQFGRTSGAVSAVMGPDDPYHQDRPVHDYPGTPGQARVHVDAGRVRSVDASSSWGFANVLGPVHPEYGPYSAIDASYDTSWLTPPLSRPTGQWLAVHYKAPVPVATVRVQTDTTLGVSEKVLEITVRAGGRTQRAAVDPVTGIGIVTFDGSPVSSLRVTVSRVSGNPTRGVVGIRDLSVARLARHIQLVVPASAMGPRGSFVLRADPGTRACLPTLAGPDCDLAAARPPEAQVDLSRQITVGVHQPFYLSGEVVARSTPAAALLTQPPGGSIHIQASSVDGDDPSVSGQFAFDNDLATTWLADPGIERPSLSLSWKPVRRLTRIQVVNALSGAAAPTAAVLRAGREVRRVKLGANGFGYFAPMHTDHVRITFTRNGSVSDRVPLGIAELKLPGLRGLHYVAPSTASAGSPCGLGPTVRIDDQPRRTFVTGSLGAVTAGTPLRFGLCGPPLQLSRGPHEISLVATNQWAVTQALLSPLHPSSPQVSERTTEITSWGVEQRTVRLGAGPAAVLRVPENANPGWQATLHGTVLTPTRVDGWQQAWLVPAGTGGTVRLSFTPGTTYRWLLALGGVAALVLLSAGVVVVARERPRLRQRVAQVGVSPDREVIGAPSRGRLRLAATVVAMVAAVAVGGVAVAVGLALGGAARRTRLPVAWLAPSLVAVAAMIAGLTALASGNVDPWAANLAGGMAVGTLCAALLVPRPGPGHQRITTVGEDA